MTEQAGSGRRAAVLISSTRAAAGIYADRTGPMITSWLQERGYAVDEPVVVADGEPVRVALDALLAARPAVVITSGGTGISADDRTPDITADLLDRELPGVMETIRRAGAEHTALAALSRGVAGTAGSTFVINLPGSEGGVRDGLGALDPLLDHICGQLEGKHEHA